MFGRGGIVEFEAVGSVVHADVKGEGLVHVAELGERASMGVAFGESAVWFGLWVCGQWVVRGRG